MSTKRGRVPAVPSDLSEEEILKYKVQIKQNLKTNESNEKCKYIPILFYSIILFHKYDL